MKKIFAIFILDLALLVFVGCKNNNDSKKLSIYLNPGVDTVEVFTTFQDKGAVANYGTSLVAVSTTSNVDTTKVGTYTITYKATYGDETVSVVRKVTVVDETSPELKLNPGVDTIVKGDNWEDASSPV